MKSLVSSIVIGLLILIPAYLHAEDFEVMECGYTYYAHLHGSSDLPLVTNYRQRGVIKNVGNTEFLNGATYYLEGLLTRPPSDGHYLDYLEGEGHYAIVIVDPDGDMILGNEYGDITLHYLGTGPSLMGEFIDGTGKYQGIKGQFELSKSTNELEDLKRHLTKHLNEMPPFGPRGWHDHEMCNKIEGHYEINS